MPSDQKNISERAALLLLTEDVLYNTLERAGSPKQIAENLVIQMREIFGGKTVVLAEYSKPDASPRVMSVCPKRMKESVEHRDFFSLLPFSEGLSTGTLWNSDTASGEISEILRRRGWNNVLVIPLQSGPEKFGALFIFDLLELNRFQILLDTLNNTSHVITMVLKNSLAYENLEDIIQERNRELLNANSELNRKNLMLNQTIAELQASKLRSEELYLLSQQALREKEILIKELYHRTKNNMQVISSLLHLRAIFENDDKVTRILTDMRNKIYTMALVHQKLYQSNNLSLINLGEYISEITDLLLDKDSLSFPVEIIKDLEDISVLIDTAIPCGLIINEVLTNAVKHSFAAGRENRISIRLKKGDNDTAELDISDNGTGFEKGFVPRESNKLGLQILYEIAEKQLRGSADYINKNGVTWIFRFPLHIYQSRI